jgi:hypothetical protein
MESFKVLYREIDVVGNRFRLLAARCDIYQRQNYWSAIDLVTGGAGNSSPRIVKELCIER